MLLRLVPHVEQKEAPGSVCDAHLGQNGILPTDLSHSLVLCFLAFEPFLQSNPRYLKSYFDYRFRRGKRDILA
jgi:hypothetical protein